MQPEISVRIGADMSGPVNVVGFRVMADGTSIIESLMIAVKESSVVDAIFNLNINGVAVWTGTARPKILAGNTHVIKGDLSISVEQFDIVSVDLIVGTAKSPIDVGVKFTDTGGGGSGVPSGGTTGQVLKKVSDTDGDADWEDESTGGLVEATQTTKTTASLANNAVENGTVALGKAFLMDRINADRECRVRLYRNATYRTADAARPIGTDPTGDHGLLFEVVFTTGNLSTVFYPPQYGVDGQATPTGDIAYAIQNLSGATHTVLVNFFTFSPTVITGGGGGGGGVSNDIYNIQKPLAPSAQDDEFDGLTLDSKWSRNFATGSPILENYNDKVGSALILKTTGAELLTLNQAYSTSGAISLTACFQPGLLYDNGQNLEIYAADNAFYQEAAVRLYYSSVFKLDMRTRYNGTNFAAGTVNPDQNLLPFVFLHLQRTSGMTWLAWWSVNAIKWNFIISQNLALGLVDNIGLKIGSNGGAEFDCAVHWFRRNWLFL